MVRIVLQYAPAPLLLALAIFAYHQHLALEAMELELDIARHEMQTTALSRASVQGALKGLTITSSRQTQFLGDSLAKNKAMVNKLVHLMQQQEHLIQSLQRGRLLMVTAYSPCVSQTDSTPFITASNQRVRKGIVAVSRDLFRNGWEFGRKVYVKDYGVYTIEDLMHRRKRNQIDIFMFDNNEALQFGRKKLQVYLLGA